MVGIRYVTEADKSFWFTLDKHLSEAEFALKVRDKFGYVDKGCLHLDNTPYEQPMEMILIKVL
jgi:hypothetical protein